MQQISVPISKIKTLVFNPQNRTTRQSLTALLDSIRRVGILVPVTLTKNYQLVDGHRRLACATLLGFEEIPAIIHEGDPRLLFAEINGTQKRITNKDMLEIYRSGGIVPPAQMAKIKAVEKYVGPAGLDRLAELGIGPGILEFALSAARYCGVEDDAGIGKVIMWMAEHKQTFATRRAMAAGIAPSVFAEVVASDTALPY